MGFECADSSGVSRWVVIHETALSWLAMQALRCLTMSPLQLGWSSHSDIPWRFLSTGCSPCTELLWQCRQFALTLRCICAMKYVIIRDQKTFCFVLQSCFNQDVCTEINCASTLCCLMLLACLTPVPAVETWTRRAEPSRQHLSKWASLCAETSVGLKMPSEELRL